MKLTQIARRRQTALDTIHAGIAHFAGKNGITLEKRARAGDPQLEGMYLLEDLAAIVEAIENDDLMLIPAADLQRLRALASETTEKTTTKRAKK